ncbi:MAG: family 10 glycosylhydrolase [Oscillospiraceae bacterium]|nr:family 10 glycosylhydrolase [Oscillospiraceae bacterium]
MKNKYTAAASLVMSFCVLAGCSTERGENSPESSVNIIDIGSAPAASSSSSSTVLSLPSSTVSTRSSVSITPAVPVSSSSSAVSSSDRDSEPPEEPADSSEPPPPVQSAISEPQGYVEDSSSEPPASSSEPVSSTLVEVSLPPETSVTSSSSSTVSSSSTESSSDTASSSTASVPEPPASSGVNGYHALNYAEVKGMWISYLDIMEMSSGTESAFRSEIAAAYDNCAALGINTVYVHVRSHGDAYYNSDLFPRTKYMSGSYDPLPIMIEEAHKRNLSFQAWINPLRMNAEKDLSRGNGYAVYDWAGSGRMVKVGAYYYLNPAYSEVIDLIARGAAEIVANYDVDGLHIDDYFYPTTDASFDSGAFADSGYSQISDFRIANCDKLVRTLYSTVKTANPSAVFGVSCQGNMDNNYKDMYADVKKWVKSDGYLDYIMPQVYFGFENSTQPFAQCVKEWDNLAAEGNVPLIVGITAAKIGAEDVWAGAGRNEWLTDSAILRRQVLESLEQMSYGGVCLFRYRLLFAPDGSVRAQIESEVSDLRSVLN